MARQLNLDRDKIDQCYQLASLIVSQSAKYVDRHSTASIEKATLLLMGLQELSGGRSLADRLVESLTKDQQRLGAAYWWGRALVGTKEEPNKLAEKLIKGKIKWEALPQTAMGEIKKTTTKLLAQTLEKIKQTLRSNPSFKIDSTGGAPLLALRSEGAKPKKFFSFSSSSQSTPTGHALHVVGAGSKNLKKEETILITEGATAPEQIVFALSSGIVALQVDGWQPVINGTMAPERSLTDFYFALALCSNLGIYFLSDPAKEKLKAPQLFASLLLYEQMAKRAGVSLEKLIFSFPFLEGVSFAQLLRETFSQSFLWLKLEAEPDPWAIWTAVFTELDVVECAPSESWEKVKRGIEATQGIQSEFLLNTHGKIAREAHSLLDQTWRLLKKIADANFWKVLDKNILFPPASSFGKEGVFQKSYHYWNPLCQELASS